MKEITLLELIKVENPLFVTISFLIMAQISRFYACNGCHDLTMLSVNLSDIAIITIRNVDYFCIIHNSNLKQLID